MSLHFILIFLGILLLGISVVFDAVSTRHYGFGKSEQLERSGNFIRVGSIIASAALFLTWLLLGDYDSPVIYPLFVTIVLAVGVATAWAACKEQVRWQRSQVHYAMRFAQITGTPGLILLEIGIILWIVTDLEILANRVHRTAFLIGGIATMIFSLVALAFLYWRHVKEQHDARAAEDEVSA